MRIYQDSNLTVLLCLNSRQDFNRPLNKQHMFVLIPHMQAFINMPRFKYSIYHLLAMSLGQVVLASEFVYL